MEGVDKRTNIVMRVGEEEEGREGGREGGRGE